MKKLLYIFALLLTTFIAKAQTTQYLGSPGTIVETRGTHKVDSVYIGPQDTLASAANGSTATKNGITYVKSGGSWSSTFNGLGYYPIQAYGGVGDSTTDNTVPIRNAIAAITASRYHSGVLYFPVGVYAKSGIDTIPLGDHIIVMGAGSGHGGGGVITRILETTINTNAFLVNGASSDFRDLEIYDSHGGTGTTSGAAIIHTAFYAYYTNVVISGFFNGLVETNNTYSIIDKCTFSDQLNHGIDLSDATNVDQGDDAITNCFFFSNVNATASSIYQSNSGGSKIANCKFNSGTTGMVNCMTYAETGATSDLFISNNSVENFSGTALIITGVSLNNLMLIGGNISSFRSGNGISIHPTTAGNDQQITINTIITAVTTAITLVGVGQVNLYNNIDKSCINGINATTVNYLNMYGSNLSNNPLVLSGCTNVYLDKQLANFSGVSGLQPSYDKEIMDSTKYYNKVTSFLAAGDTTVTSTYVQDEFSGTAVTDISGRIPDTRAMGAWYSIYPIFGNGITTLGVNSSGQLYCPASGSAFYGLPINLTNYDVSLVVVNATTTNTGLLGNLLDNRNYLQLDMHAGIVYQNVAGSLTVVSANSTTYAIGDTIHLRVRGNVASSYKNSTLIGSGTFNSALLNVRAIGVLCVTNTTAIFDHLVVSNQGTGVHYKYAISHDASLVGDGTNTSSLSANRLHATFTPSTGGTVALVNNQYNIINPSGTLTALTATLPSSPANNDVVTLKFTQAVTTLTYSGGTVVGAPTTVTAGQSVSLTYDSATTSWY